MIDGMTRAELLEAARRMLGYPITRDQFKAFRVEGLIPPARPEARKSGRPTYPPGTLKQLVAVRRFHQEERRFDELRLLVWWNGYWVSLDPLVRSLAKVLDDAVADLRQIRAAHPEPEEAAEAVVELVEDPRRSRSPAVRLFRRRMGRDDEDMRSAFYALFVFAFGGEPIWHVEDVGLDELDETEESPLHLVEKAMGLPRLLSDQLEGGKPLLSAPPDTRETLLQLRDAGLLDIEQPGNVMRSASAEELEIARVRARAFWEDFINAVEIIEYRQGRDTAGLGLFSAMRKRDFYWGIAVITRFWFIVPSLIPEDRSTEFIEAVEANRDKLTASLAFTEAFPGYKPFFTPGGEQRLASLPAEEREQIAHSLNTYINEHPEARCLLEE